jgi:hypothetical protein
MFENPPEIVKIQDFAQYFSLQQLADWIKGGIEPKGPWRSNIELTFNLQLVGSAVRHFLLLTFFFYQLASIDTWPPIEEEGGVAGVYDPAGLRAAAPSSVDFRVHKIPAPKPRVEASNFHQNFPLFGRTFMQIVVWFEYIEILWDSLGFFGILQDSDTESTRIDDLRSRIFENLWESWTPGWDSFGFSEILWDSWTPGQRICENLTL